MSHDAPSSNIGPIAFRHVFIAGATGYVGSRLALALLERGHRVRALVRPGSEAKLPRGAEPVVGDALSASTYAARVAPCDTFVQLVGVAHPSPAKAEAFRRIDAVAGREAVAAAVDARVSHFVYVSVAQPAPVMKAYVDVRRAVEERIAESGMNATVLRPWYIVGPGHYWPVLLKPLYALAETWPSTRDGARRLGLVSIADMIAALLQAVEHPARGITRLDVPAIRRLGRAKRGQD